jgi:S1-C subfamily serine protease
VNSLTNGDTRLARATEKPTLTPVETKLSGTNAIPSLPEGFVIEQGPWLDFRQSSAATNGVGFVIGEPFSATKVRAETGEAAAEAQLGTCYMLGQGVTANYSEAVRWFLKAGEQGHPLAQVMLYWCYATGTGVPKDKVAADMWLKKQGKTELDTIRPKAERGDALCQYILGLQFRMGEHEPQDDTEAVKWWQKAADQDLASAEASLGESYLWGQGVAKDSVQAFKWLRKAAEQGDAVGEARLGEMYSHGEGVARNDIEAYKWLSLALAQSEPLPGGDLKWKERLNNVEARMSRAEIVESQRAAAAFAPRKETSEPLSSRASETITAGLPHATATGFFITDDGFFVTAHHVVGQAAQVYFFTRAGPAAANVVKVDAANDLALLKANGKFSSLPVASSRSVRLGNPVATVGFPNIGLQGFAPKLAKGEIASLSGAGDDARYFQISVPVQPGNSGGALVDERGNVVGVVSAKLSARAALAASGSLPENVNYAVKSSFLLGFLESVPEVSAKLKMPNTKDQKFEDVVRSAEQAAVLVLVY